MTIKQEPKTEPTEPKISSADSNAKAKPAGRSFVPNLNARRSEVKVEPTTDADSRDKKPRRPITPNLGARGGRGSRGGKREANLIQSHSIFEAGPAESTKRYGSERNAADSHSKVVGISSSGGGSAHVYTGNKDDANGSFHTGHSILTEDTKEEVSTVYVKLKNENKENENVERSETGEVAETKAEQKDRKTLYDIMNPGSEEKSQEQLLMFQLPENLGLRQLGEGRIGKIKVYKSGKIMMCLDEDSYLNVSLSVSGGFLQDAIVLDNVEDVSETSDIKKMHNIGHIKHKIVCAPKLF